ncbi:MAG: hypothetical protein C4570_03380 [Ammonifex sp.]|nr:MAG: hypothetical protein C4570_03380 [Ammonifex sp.]
MKGKLIRLSLAFTDASDAAVDPTTVSVRIRPPDGVKATYVYGVDAELVRDGVGNYHFDLSLEQYGMYGYYAWSTGTGQAAAHGEIKSVEPVA